MGNLRSDMTEHATHAVLWPVIRAQAGLPGTTEATAAWRAALQRIMDGRRPDSGWGGQRGEASSA